MANPTMEACLAVVNAALRDTANKSYTTLDKYEAIRFVLSEFGRLTRYPLTTANIQFVQDTYTLDVTATATDFLPQRASSVRIGTSPVKIVAFEKVRLELLDAPTAEGKPEMIGWETPAVAWVFPTPDIFYNAKLTYSQPVGDLPNPGSIIPFPLEWARPCLWYGVPAVLRTAEKDDLSGDALWMKFMGFVAGVNGTTQDDIGDVELDEAEYL